MGKGSRDRTADKKKYRGNYENINWKKRDTNNERKNKQRGKGGN